MSNDAMVFVDSHKSAAGAGTPFCTMAMWKMCHVLCDTDDDSW